jgi:hypothetical protein
MAPMTMSNRSLAMDVLLTACLVGLVIAARLVPHAPNFSPVVAAGLFAGMVFRSRALALAVPVAGMLLSDLILGSEDLRMRLVIYAALALPVVLGIWGQRFRIVVALLPLTLSSSLVFFAVSNLAVWAFSGMYTLDLSGLARCYVLALPFLQNTVIGDIAWIAALFGSWRLVHLWMPTERRTSAPASLR